MKGSLNFHIFLCVIIPFRETENGRKESAQLKATRRMSAKLQGEFHEMKEIIQEQTDPNLEKQKQSQGMKKEIQFNLHTKGENKTRKRRFSGNEFN